MATVPQKNKETLSIRTLGTLESPCYKMSFVMVFQERKALGEFSQVNYRRRGCCLCWWLPAALADSARLVQEGTATTKALWNCRLHRERHNIMWEDSVRTAGRLSGQTLTRIWAADRKRSKILIHAGLGQVHDGLIFRILFWPNFTKKVQNSSVLLKQNVHSFIHLICISASGSWWDSTTIHTHTRTRAHTHTHSSVQFRLCNTATCMYLQQQHNGRTCKLDT